MAKTIIDLSGRGGLLERFQGDFNDTSSSPNLRYLGAENQYAEGFWNPFAYYGYTSPSVNSFTPITGSVTADISAFVYDDASGKLYVAEEGKNIRSFSDLEDISIAQDIQLTSGKVKDMLIYEMNAEKALVFIKEDTDADTLSVGFRSFESKNGILNLDGKVLGLNSSNDLAYGLVQESDSDGTNFFYRKLAQPFDSDDLGSLQVSGFKAAVNRSGGTGSGITIKFSIQGDQDRDSGEFTYQGTWANATSYSVNDTVTQSSVDYQCIQAHTSSTANDQPGSGTNWEDYWEVFGAPDGTDILSGTVGLDELPDGTSLTEPDQVYDFVFSENGTLTASTKYWIVFEESGTNMGSGDAMDWLTSVNDNATYTVSGYQSKALQADGATDFWVRATSAAANSDNFDFQIIANEVEDWSSTVANGAFSTESGQQTYLYLGDNGLVYWVTGKTVHTIDGSATGGTTGTINESVLLFPSYTEIPDNSETRGRMYIAVQTSVVTNAETEFFNAYRSGIFVWDRRSTVIGGTDFFPTPGAREIKSVFTSSTGEIVVLSVNNSGFCEIRLISGNQFAVVQTLEKDAYPVSRNSISQVGNITMWVGKNGHFYAYGAISPGEQQRVYKIGSISDETNFNEPGAIFVGNKDTSNNEMAVYIGWNQTSAGDVTCDSYSDSNIDTDQDLFSTSKIGQSFTGDGNPLKSATFYLKNSASATGTIQAELYAMSGGFPTGSALATSDIVDVSTIGATYEAVEFNFDDSYLLEDGTDYTIAVAPKTTLSTNFYVGVDNSSPTDDGSGQENFSAAWVSVNYHTPFIVTSIQGYNISKWYPNGEGTIDSVTQVARQGNVYSKVFQLAGLSTVRYIRGFHAPGGTDGDATVAATLKCYVNQSTTPEWSRSITYDDLYKGWFEKEWNKPNVNFIQFEIEWNTTPTLGSNTYRPMYLEIETADEGRINS